MTNSFTVKIFDPAIDGARWNDFVALARQSSFLFNRAYMDYHSERFDDHSLMIFKGKRLFAVLPANREGDTLTSHGGLTYGGLLTGLRATVADIAQALGAIMDFSRDRGISQIIYKPTPYIYHTQPADEDLFCLWHDAGARLVARQISSTIDGGCRGRFFDIRRQGARRAREAGITINRSTTYAPFWDILERNLSQRHDTRPVHSLAEMELLASRFPDNITLWTANDAAGDVVAGVVMYMTRNVAHSQYISASPRGREIGALDLLFDTVINYALECCRYFDFGISTECRGATLNHGLIYQKEGFGARATLYDIYQIDL